MSFKKYKNEESSGSSDSSSNESSDDEQDDHKKTCYFDDICKKYNIQYSIKPYAYNENKSVIEILPRFIHSNCIMVNGNFMYDTKLKEPLSKELINILTILSGSVKSVNELIAEIYNCMEKKLSKSYLIVYVTCNSIYFKITDLLSPQCSLLSGEAYSTNIVFSFGYNKLNIDKSNFYFDSTLYKFNEDNLNKLIAVYNLKYDINQRIKNMHYSEKNSDMYYIKTKSFGDTIHEFSIETTGINDVYIKFNGKKVNIDKIDDIVKKFNLCK